MKFIGLLHQAAAQLRVRVHRLRDALRELGVQWPRPRKKSRNTAFGTAGRQHTWSEAAQVVCADLSRVKLQTLSSASAFVHGGCVRGACVYDGRWEVKEACAGRCPDFNMRHVERARLSAATLPSWHFFLGGFALSLPAATRNGWCTWAR
jgi:hypothetical protein